MLNLYKIDTKKEQSVELLSEGEKISVHYHSLFDFPLSFSDLIKWKAADNLKVGSTGPEVLNRNGLYFVEGKEAVVYKRFLHKRVSTKKFVIANKASKILSFLPSIKMIAITGSLAMENSTEESDIDLMLVTSKNKMWTTRLAVYFLLNLFGVKTRIANDKNQKDKLCLNMWLDESDMVWSKTNRNIYTAHEIAQIVPILNKDKTYERFIFQNKWVKKYWPNAVRISNPQLNTFKNKNRSKTLDLALTFVEKIAFKLQYHHMESKITREEISSTHAFFHPQDWGKVVLTRLSS